MKSNKIILNLSNHEITDEDDIFNQIEHPENVIELDLSNNSLSTLPLNLSKFKHLQKLILTQNPIQSYTKAAVSLSSLPSLEILNIDLSTNENALQILKALPKLKVLNNVTTEEQNQIEPNFEYELKYNLEGINSNENQEGCIRNNKTSSQEVSTDLIILNSKEILDIDESNLDMFSINNEIRTFHQINEMIIKLKLQDAHKFNKLFQSKLTEQIAIIDNCMDIPNYEYAMIITKAKIDIYDFLLDYVMEQFNHSHLFPELSYISNLLRTNVKKNQNCLYTIILQLKGKINSLKEADGNHPYYNSEEYREVHTNKTNESPSFNSKGTSKQKKITKKHLKHIISEVIQAKEAFNKKNNNEFTKLNKATMKSFLTSFLLKKYGLQKITLELHDSIVKAIDRYSKADSEICLFGKILNNDIEEESITVFSELKKTIHDLLSYYYIKKYPYKSNHDIESLAKSKQSSSLTLDEWRTILTSIFSDSEVVLKKMIEYVINKNKVDEAYMELNIPKMDRNHRYTKEEMKEINYEAMNILYDDFIKVLLDFQIKLREKYLKPFVKVYKQVDVNNEGIIDEVQFAILIKALEIFDLHEVNSRIDELLKVIDPFNSNKITFSDCVSFLGKEPFTKGINCSILDKINMSNIGTIALEMK